MDVVLVGLPGSGKSAVGRRLAHRHGASFVDLDESIEKAAGRTIPEIFATDGEAAFRTLERAAVAELGPADPGPAIRRVVATGGGAVVDPRNRWALYRGRIPIWLDGRPEVLAQRLRRSPNVRPLVTGRDPIGAIRSLAKDRERFYAPGQRLNSASEVGTLVDRVDEIAAARTAAAGSGAGTVLLRADTPSGHIVIGTGIAAAEAGAALSRAGGRRAILVSEPGAWAAAGESIARRLTAEGWSIERVMLPQGEDAKRLSVVEEAGARACPPPRRTRRAARRDRWRGAWRRGGLPRGDLAQGRADHPRPDDAGRPDRLVDRRQDRRRPPGGEEPRRGVPPAGGGRHRRRRSCARCRSASDERRSARR